MITPLFVLFSKTILTQEVTMDFYFLINCSTSLYNRPKKYDEVKIHQHKRALALTARKFVRLIFGLLAKHQLYSSDRVVQA